MPPKKLPPKQPPAQAKAKMPSEKPNSAQPSHNKPSEATTTQRPQQRQQQQAQIPEKDIKQSSSISAGYALEAGKKAYELRQAAVAAGDPDAREEILGKAINKEIEAEQFGKAAKYARTGAFQGLAAGAGIGIQPGATIGTLTGAIVGGLLSTVGGLLGGGIGSAYGAIAGPMWDLGGLASHGVRGVVNDFIGDWPDFGTSTKHQKDSLEKMVLGAKNTTAPSQDELEEMRADDGGASPESYAQIANDMTSYLPSLDSMPTFESVSQRLPSMPKSMPGFSPSGSNGTSGSSGSKATSKASNPSAPNPVQATSNRSGQKQQTEPTRRPPKLEKRSTPAQKPSPAGTTSAKQSSTTKSPPKLENRKSNANGPSGPKAKAPKLGPRSQAGTVGA